MWFNTPRSLAAVIAFALTVILTTCFILYLFYSPSDDAWWWPVMAAIFIFSVSFVLIFFTVQRFLYNHIKLLYRTIQSKKSGEAKRIEIAMSDSVLEEVGSKVSQWAEKKKEEIQHLKKQEAFRREFLGNLAHELKTPVFSVQGYILTLLEGGLEDPSINRDYLGRAAGSIDRITRILEEVDTITNFEAEEIQLTIKKFNITKLAKEVLKGLEIKAREKQITLRTKEEYLEINVLGDRTRIDRVLLNLVGNAINYGKEGGYVEIRFYDMPESVLIEVADDGIGIAEENFPRLFERFFRVDKSRSRHIEGTGLGLAIVKHLVEAHGQSIHLRSTEGVGSTFSFSLPKA